MTENEATVQEVVFMDRTVRLVWLGILQIIFGGFFALIVSLTLLEAIVSAASGKDAAEWVSLKKVIPVILLFALVAVWFIWVGIGSVKARRWARALILISSWFWLIGGVMGIANILLLPNMPEITTFMSLFCVIIPSLLVLFYSGKDVKATCEYRDPRVRWTDRCPLPVLAASIVCAVWPIPTLLSAAYGGFLPFFGTILSGMSAAVVILISGSLFVYAGIGMYKLDKKAWWIALALTTLWSLSLIITSLNGNILALYEKMNLSPQELEMTKKYSSPNMDYLSIILEILQVGYFVYIRRYFKFGQDERIENM